MKTIKGPAIFLAQFIGENPPYNSLDGLCQWVAEMDYKGIQIPTWEDKLIDLPLAAESLDYCQELKGKIQSYGLEITELSTHLQGQLMAVHPAYNVQFSAFAPKSMKGNPIEWYEWAQSQLKYAANASKNLGITAHATFSGSLLWHTMYPWPQRPSGLVDAAFDELSKRWLPILQYFDECGVDLCYEIHPGEDIFDGITYELFLDKVQQHPRACILYDPSHFLLQQLDYVQFIDLYHSRIKAFHVKDAEFRPSGRCGVYGGYADWKDRAGRFRSLGDGQIDFKQIFSKLTQYGYDGWAVMEWECCIKSPEQGAREGANFIRDHIIETTGKAFDDFAAGEVDDIAIKRILGIL
ncbi:MAG: sugar phosphate isomerase/epimerase [Lewinellaceae bacterium]|nr:sugar phosphate isomerase/epimerase [Lewinellaceae bacterium]